MEGERFGRLYSLVQEEAKLRGRTKRVWFSDAVIVLVYFWAVLHDRPVAWACEGRNWPEQRDGPGLFSLPSAPTMSRRLRTLRCGLLLTGVYDRLRSIRSSELTLCRRIDTKPLVVSGFSKDRDAKRGYATGGMARGYKLAVVWGKNVLPDALTVAPLNVSDPICAAKLIDQLALCQTSGYLLADATQDSNPLHEYAAAHTFQLLTPRKKPGTELGHRDHSLARLRSIERLEGPGQFGKSLYQQRGDIERDLAHLCGFGGGLQPLPSWVRHPARVARWVIAKLIINGLRQCKIKGVAA
jgi:hypothetical protein